MNLEEMRNDSSVKQKNGLHFILASVILWSAVLAVHLTELPILTKNLLTFFITAPLMPLAYLISKVIRVDFTNRNNPLTSLGVLFSANQMLYLLIAMWVYPTVPEKMVMVLAMIFGAHLLPYGWLYKSRSYYVFSVLIPILILFLGIYFPPYIVAGSMLVIEILFSLSLTCEVKRM
ncbi:DUF7010 family protein [Proteiniclasticum sp. C24MP]|uniref:DUF7010 family protein n=1 Tax=Proteiniclasticum sp. C24MP TaxID=3374101 RepID=UPI00375463AD